MTNIKPLFMFAIAITGAMMVSGDCLAQGQLGCTTENCGVANTVSYPVASCGDCGIQGCGGCRSRGGLLAFNRSGGGLLPLINNAEYQAKKARTKANCAKVMARNQAWPMPFDCADRQLYFQVWEPMIDQGFEEQCVLSSVHFDPKTGELNHFGVHTVAGIMQNMPSSRREVFVHRDSDPRENESRMAAVKKTIDTYYANSGPARVSFSSQLPTTIRGTKAESISQLWFDNQPTPVIKISTGQSVTSSVGG